MIGKSDRKVPALPIAYCSISFKLAFKLSLLSLEKFAQKLKQQEI